jgi:sulfhydrogenase subunit beta (sulfur reductase)
MKELLLKKENVKSLCIEACNEWETYVPLEGMGQDVQFVKINDRDKNFSLDKMNLDYESLVIPPKVIGFPQIESLFKFQGEKITETVQHPGKKLLFGLRACDLKGMLFMDEFFRRDFQDIYYLNRSTDRLLVLVGCKHPPRDCFCRSAGQGEESEFDLQMVDVGDVYLVELGSKKAEEFVNTYRKFFDEASKEMVSQSKKAKRAAELAVSLKVDFEKAIKNLCEDKLPEGIYERIGERCIYCGGCLYVCPTCTCFNVFDEKEAPTLSFENNSGGRRCRNWDACVFEGYTREASGHNPRLKKWIRTSRRYEHKLKYDYLATGMSGCVGCGRCLSSCPVNIGIVQVIEEAAKI